MEEEVRITTYGLVTLDEMLAAQKQVEDDRARKVRGVGLGHRGRPEYTWQAVQGCTGMPFELHSGVAILCGCAVAL